MLRFDRAMEKLGHTVYRYYGKKYSPYVNKVSQQELKWDGALEYWQIMKGAVTADLAPRLDNDHFICLITSLQQPIVEAINKLNTGKKFHVLEYGIGYADCLALRMPTANYYSCVESKAWYHVLWGHLHTPFGCRFTPRATVVPNGWEEDEFSLGDGSGGYVLFIGRLIKLKGLTWVHEAIRKFPATKFVIAGAIGSGGDETLANELLKEQNVNYRGVIRDKKEKDELYGKAFCTLVPTEYCGPFEGVHIESLMAGTPVVTTPYGVFSETIEQGFNGFTADSLPEFFSAIKRCQRISASPTKRNLIRQNAIARFGMEHVGKLYETFCQKITMGIFESAEKQRELARLDDDENLLAKRTRSEESLVLQLKTGPTATGTITEPLS